MSSSYTHTPHPITWCTGKLASLGGGLFASHRIPFARTVTIAVQYDPKKDDKASESRSFFFMARGLTNYPVIGGGG